MKEKKTKKHPFCVSSVSHKLSEFPHSFDNNGNKLTAIRIKVKDLNKMTTLPLPCVKNVSFQMFKVIFDVVIHGVKDAVQFSHPNTTLSDTSFCLYKALTPLSFIHKVCLYLSSLLSR